MTEHPIPEASPRILVLTPVKNAARHLQRHFELIQRLNVPRERLSIGLLESDSTSSSFISPSVLVNPAGIKILFQLYPLPRGTSAI